jgi:cystathionine beta-synthase
MSVLDAVGNTPLIRLTRVTAGLATPVHLKASSSTPAAA